MGCKVSKTIVVGPHHAKSSGKQAGSPESASLASSAPTTVPAADSSFSTSRSSSPPGGSELSSHSNLVISENRPTPGETTSGSEIAVKLDRTDLAATGDDVLVVHTTSRASEDRKSTPELGEGGVVGNGDLQPCFAGVCCSGAPNACTGAEYCMNLNQVNRNKCHTAPSSPQASCNHTPRPTATHSAERAPAVDAHVCLPATTPPAAVTPPPGKPPLMRGLGPPHAKAIKITSVTVLQQPDSFNSLHGATIVTNGVTLRSAEDRDTSMPRAGEPAPAQRSVHTSTLDHQEYPPSCCNVKVTNSHTIDYVHSFLASHITASEGVSKAPNRPNGSLATNQNEYLEMKSGASVPENAIRSKTSPRIVIVTNSATQYVTNGAGQKIGAVHQPVASAPSTPEERTPLSTSPFPYGGLAIDPADCSTLPSLDSRRKLPPIQTSLPHASQLKLSTQTLDPFMKPSLLQQAASTPNRDKQVDRSSSPLVFREVEVESPDSSPSSTSTRPDFRASVDSSSSSDCSSDTMIGSRFKETLEKADTNASGWTSIEDFLSLRKSPNISLLEFEIADNPSGQTGPNVLGSSLEVQEDHALAFESSKIRYNNFNCANTGTTRPFFQSED